MENDEGRIEFIAKAAHEMNRLYCQFLGDYSQLAWDKAPAWQRRSCTLGVVNIMAEPSMTPEQSHILWWGHKEAEGWTYGPEKDPKKKEHPCMVAYGKLAPDQRAKDSIFGATVRGLLGQ